MVEKFSGWGRQWRVGAVHARRLFTRYITELSPALPLAAIYALTGRGLGDRLSIRSPSKAESLFILMRNTCPEYPLHPTDHARNFNILLRPANRVPL